MLTPELQDYIKQARGQGTPDAQIRQNLLSGGWNETDLNEAGLAVSMVPPQTPPMQQASQIQPNIRVGVTTTPGVYVQKKSHAGLYMLIVIVFLLLGAAGGYAYYSENILR